MAIHQSMLLIPDSMHTGRRPRKVLGYRTPAEVFSEALVPP